MRGGVTQGLPHPRALGFGGRQVVGEPEVPGAEEEAPLLEQGARGAALGAPDELASLQHHLVA